jgi:hypothetical protein
MQILGMPACVAPKTITLTKLLQFIWLIAVGAGRKSECVGRQSEQHCYAQVARQITACNDT